MADLSNVQAAPGRRVLDPDTMRPIPASDNPDGKTAAVDLDRPFWHRRLADADIVIVNAAEAAADDAQQSPPASPPPPAKPAKSNVPAADASGADQPIKE